MTVGDRFGPDVDVTGRPEETVGQTTVTVTLSSGALGALGAYLRSGAARGLPFEQPLLEAVGGAGAGSAAPRGTRCALSQRTQRKVREYIEEHLADDIGVADIASAASLSPHHLGRSFRQATGQSLWQYVLARRAHRARGLIERRPRTTLHEIAALSGFESYSQFIAAFRKLHGVTPGDWRRAREQAQ
jgi:AraC-like DNA-binding protein